MVTVVFIAKLVRALQYYRFLWWLKIFFNVFYRDDKLNTGQKPFLINFS